MYLYIYIHIYRYSFLYLSSGKSSCLLLVKNLFFLMYIGGFLFNFRFCGCCCCLSYIDNLIPFLTFLAFFFSYSHFNILSFQQIAFNTTIKSNNKTVCSIVALLSLYFVVVILSFYKLSFKKNEYNN
jgi:hypothetical protein